MDYEKKYKETLEKVEDFLKRWECVEEANSSLVLEEVKDIFPEFKESEDERIRKTLIAFHKSTIDINGVKGSEIIAWLEKQGKLKSSKWTEGDVVRHGGVLALVTNGRRAMKSNYEQITIQYPDEWVKADSQERKHFFEELDKQSKQNEQKQQGKTAHDAIKEENVDNANKNISKFKAEDWYVSKVDGKIHNIHSDNVEPKFNIGDWVVFNNNHESIYQIEKIENFQYILRHTLGGSMPLSFSHEDMIRLWTIQDAKLGDVLASGQVVFMFKMIHGVWLYCHCSLHNDGSFIAESYDLLTEKYFSEVHPATKEQSNLLFQKIKEEGYEWDDKNKELKKIETKGGEE